MRRPVEVVNQRFDGRLNRRVRARLLDEQDGAIRLAVPFGSTFFTATGVWRPRTAAIYRFWRDRWHNVCTIVSPETRRPAFLYCDVLAPVSFDGARLSYVDLDFDLIVQPDWSFRVLDADDFATHRIELHYPADLVAGTLGAVESLERALSDRTGAFRDERLFTLDVDERHALGLV